MSNPVSNFEIHLDHDVDEQYQYEPGELMKGKIIVCSEEGIRIKGILVQVKGEATVSWPSEGQGGETLSTNEIYVDETFPVIGSDQADSGSVELAKGEQSFPFQYHLPLSLPSSFIGKYGSVTYIVKATLREDRSAGGGGGGGGEGGGGGVTGVLGTMITTEPFLVLRPVDLASNPELRQRRSAVASRRTSGTSLFCCLFGKTIGRFSANKTGLLPGDDVIIDADVTNDASQPVKSIEAALVLVCTFQAQKLTRNYSQTVVKKTNTFEVDYGVSRKWTGVRLLLPSYIPESRLDGCDMIDIAYELRFRLEMADGSDVTASIPITVGTPKRKAAAPVSQGSVRMSGNVSVAFPSCGRGDGGPEADMENDLEKFRHPMIPGETRKNILFDGNID